MLLSRIWKRLRTGERGHSLIETAFVLPLLLGIAFNAINFGYFWFMVLTLSAAPRHGAQYATQGGASLATVSTPGTTQVSNLVYQNLTSSIVGATTANASVRVCSSAKGVDASTYVALCDSFGPSQTFATPAADPEAPLFVLHRVDVAYQVTPLIPGTVFNVILPSNLVFKRQVSMRSLY
jgi:Flp pilus assembly protein TadG